MKHRTWWQALAGLGPLIASIPIIFLGEKTSLSIGLLITAPLVSVLFIVVQFLPEKDAKFRTVNPIKSNRENTL